MNKPITINNDPYPHAAMDFEELLKESIGRLQKTVGHRWTDFNEHDPGLTILEQLCYALTDLSYRVNFDIEDHLASQNGKGRAALYSPGQILPSRPVTLRDYRKMAIDVEGVRNAWIEKATFPITKVFYNDRLEEINLLEDEAAREIKVKGLYRVFVDLHDSNEPQILDRVRARLMAARNLCEDFLEVQFLPQQPVLVDLDVEVGRVEDLKALSNEIYERVADFISPQIKFQTLQEMRAQGMPMDEIFEGPGLAHGFIDDKELDGFQRKSELRSSDLIQVIMDIEGVNAVRKVTMKTSATPPEQWLLKLDDQKSPRLNRGNSRMRIFRDNLEAGTFQPTATAPASLDRPLLREWQKDLILEARRERNPGQYHSIQHAFPATFGLGKATLPDSATIQRKALVRQLRGYLLFFEQIIANYHAQTEHVGTLFSFDTEEIRTVFSNSLLDVVPEAEFLLNPMLRINKLVALSTPGTFRAEVEFPLPKAGETIDLFHEGVHVYAVEVDRVEHDAFFFAIAASSRPFLGADAWQHPKEKVDQTMATMVESEAEARRRKNRILNHLLARFSEDFSEYTLLLNRLETEASGPLQRAIEDKLRFLRSYIPLSRDRAGAFNHAESCLAQTNVSGYLRRVAAKLGIRDFRHRFLAESTQAYFRQNWIAEPAIQDLMSPLLSDRSLYLFHPESKRILLRIEQLPEDTWPATASEFEAVDLAQEAERLASAWEATIEPGEGFHLVEHILLRPRLIDKALGHHVLPLNRQIRNIVGPKPGGTFVCTDSL
ncbi:MAG TPA: hypothetical protein ENJ82_14490, partial [Bacteroidetes bacterium]|nr:hypothetical protein [Bacteroidota bacterium]